ncbi:transmembrane protein 176A-like [Hoplias malabaricus]|uniref:transmembrane protein 176A-like n=2 Tax=Hoplias malabaricus TaxID=27720 RepID=UPI0034619300
MSVTVAKSEGVTVLTVTSDPKSKCPLICQILGTLCCGSFCSVSQTLKQKLGNIYTALGTAQIFYGLMNLAVGAVYTIIYIYGVLYSCGFWLGGVFIAIGIICVVAKRFFSQCLVTMMLLLNLASAALSITAVVLYAIDFNFMYYYFYGCSWINDQYRYGPSDLKMKMMENCEDIMYRQKVLRRGMDIMMIFLGVILLCLTISSCVLSLKALCKKKGDKMDPEIHKPLVEEDLSSPECEKH